LEHLLTELLLEIVYHCSTLSDVSRLARVSRRTRDALQSLLLQFAAPLIPVLIPWAAERGHLRRAVCMVQPRPLWAIPRTILRAVLDMLHPPLLGARSTFGSTESTIEACWIIESEIRTRDGDAATAITMLEALMEYGGGINPRDFRNSLLRLAVLAKNGKSWTG
jgi:hypothetical protein